MFPCAVDASVNPYSTLARSVESGMLPCIDFSHRAISEPPSRPESCSLIPLAPASMHFSIACFIVRRKLARFSSCSAISCATICGSVSGRPISIVLRSEEHTSELQSLRHLVCRLLLEKKKLNLSNLKLLRRITRTENILHRNITRRQVDIQNRVARNNGISHRKLNVTVIKLFRGSRRA